MQPSTLHTPFGEVAFQKFGSGPRLLIAFHGFSEAGSAFAEMGVILEGSCTLYAIDLPFHGSTRWQGADYRPAQLAALVEALLEREGRPHFEAIGHSLGARLWLHLLPEFRGRIEGLYLLAPDGLQTRWMYLVEWMPAGFRRGLIPFLSHPGWLLSLAKALHRTRLIGRFLLQYLRVHLSEAGRRRRLLHTWLALSHFRLSKGKARCLIRQAGLPVLVLLGDKDQLVKPETIRHALKGLKNVRIEEINATHRSICRVAAPWIERGGWQ
ncbi:MAG: alpha/beta fold hydrolase [Lewinellaceae bacterium]|nr:alpha/beta fold hydrolase [Phaeodactylibacter sp.]MCB0615450.1 alpha/beta fold hydrolase [Phaeodactylibacter sp.]MCB9347223.1 alpha/beta fold hydrolase [Lewinellaceae bacterium]